MIGSLFAGISGLNANATALTVIGDNIANVNTTGFKSSRASFANVLSQSLGGSSGNEIGRGVQLWGTSPLWTQGSLENTGSSTDVAINGKGFFILKDTDGSLFYSRAGEFTFDKNGLLLNPDGLIVQGYPVDSNGALDPITDITVPGESTAAPNPTGEFTLDVNLDAGSDPGQIYTTTLTIFDSLGNDLPITLTFTKDNSGPPPVANQWGLTADIPASYGTATLTGAPINLNFDANGELAAGSTDLEIALTLDTGAGTPQNIQWNLVDDSGDTWGDLTQYSAESATTFQIQDGYPSGVLRNISIDEMGFVTGAYSNGRLVPLFQMGLADFPSYYGLAKSGDNLYRESLASGQAMPGTPGNGTLGNLTPNALEMSNVDLAQEFVKMITTQRAFQANAKVITTSDEILAELINIKR